MSKKSKRILTGVQSTGIPHLGNILGAIIPAINFSKNNDVETYLFIADFGIDPLLFISLNPISMHCKATLDRSLPSAAAQAFIR